MTILALFPHACELESPIAQAVGSSSKLPTPGFALKGEITASFNGFTYCPFEVEGVATATKHLLDFATERYLWDGYEPFVPNILMEYPEFGWNAFDPLDSAMLTAYSEGFLYRKFKNLLAVIRDQHQTHLNYTSLRLLELLAGIHEWSRSHAGQFEDSAREVFTYHMQHSPASPLYAFIQSCTELGLPLDRWVSREKTVFRKAFGYEFTGVGAGAGTDTGAGTCEAGGAIATTPITTSHA